MKEGRFLSSAISFAICVAMITSAVSGCSKGDKTPVNTSDGVETTTVKATETSSYENINKPVEELIEIETPYCTLNYPKKWESFLKYTENDENGVYTQTYYCLLDKAEYELFTIIFGDDNRGTLIGYIMNNGEKIPFSVSSLKFSKDELTEEDLMIISGMDYSVNTIIESVTASPNYIP